MIEYFVFDAIIDAMTKKENFHVVMGLNYSDSVLQFLIFLWEIILHILAVTYTLV